MRARLILILGTLVIMACGTQPLSVRLMDFDDELAQFTVRNKSGLDVRSARFEIRYEVAGEDGLQADTLSYETTRNQSGEVPFIRSGKETFFPHQLPEGASRPTAHVLSVEFWNGTSWERG